MLAGLLGAESCAVRSAAMGALMMITTVDAGELLAGDQQRDTRGTMGARTRNTTVVIVLVSRSATMLSTKQKKTHGAVYLEL